MPVAPRRANPMIGRAASAAQAGSATKYLVQTPAGVLYHIFIETNSDIYWRKSSDGGLSWTEQVVIFSGTAISLSIWYDRWSGIAAGLIHLAYTETGGSDTLYRTLDTESSDALSTQTTIFVGSSAVATGSFLSICRARGGNVYCRTQIDAGAEGGFFRLPNANVPNDRWDAARTINEANATLDQMILLPGWAADNQDMMAIFWDASANEISRQLYDDSANSWGETSISGSMVEQNSATAWPNFAAAVDIANSRNVIIAWTQADLANADLRCWTVTESAITEVTNVVLNSTDDQGMCALCIDTVTGYWWAFYCGISSGGETYPSAVNVYCKVSQDAGVTWGAETLLNTGGVRSIIELACVMRMTVGEPVVRFFCADATLWSYLISVAIPCPAAAYQMGI